MAIGLLLGFFITENGYAYNLVLAVAGVTLAFTGSGGLSLDAFLGSPTRGTAWGLAAIILGLAGGGIQLAQRRSMAWPVTNDSAQNRGTAA